MRFLGFGLGLALAYGLDFAWGALQRPEPFTFNYCQMRMVLPEEIIVPCRLPEVEED